MAASSHPLEIARFAGALAWALLAACSSTKTLEGAGTCVEGQTQECSCVDGQLGVRECARNSEYGMCICQGPRAGGEPVAGVAGNPLGGSGGFAAIGGMNATAGTTGGSAGAGGMAGGGEGGSGGASGQAGIGGSGEGGMSGPGRDPQPGELYGECRADVGCDDGLWCISDSSNGSAESYCTTMCDPLSSPPCPRSRGDGMVVCILGLCVR